MKVQSKYNPNGGYYTECPNCGAVWYEGDPDIDTYEMSKEENPEGYDSFCQNCREFFDQDYKNKKDPSEQDVESMFKEGFTECEWALMTPTDKRCFYVDYCDFLNKDGVISDLMINNMSGHSEG